MSRIFENMLVGSQQTFVWNVGNTDFLRKRTLSLWGSHNNSENAKVTINEAALART